MHNKAYYIFYIIRYIYLMKRSDFLNFDIINYDIVNNLKLTNFLYDPIGK